MTSSPFSLDTVRLAFECPMRWEKLARVASGKHPNGVDDEKRFCHACNKHVHNLSAMSRAEAEALVRDDATPICVRIEVDAAGRSIHRPSRPAMLAGAVLAAGLAGGAPTADSDSSPNDVATSPGASVEVSAIPELGDDGARLVTGQARVTEATAATGQGTSDASIIPEVSAAQDVVTPPTHVLMGEPPAQVPPRPSIMGGIRPVDTAPLGRVRSN